MGGSIYVLFLCAWLHLNHTLYLPCMAILDSNSALQMSLKGSQDILCFSKCKNHHLRNRTPLKWQRQLPGKYLRFASLSWIASTTMYGKEYRRAWSESHIRRGLARLCSQHHVASHPSCKASSQMKKLHYDTQDGVRFH